jgi:ribonuclease HI
VRLTTDSKYVLQGITEWLAGWKRKQWKNSARQPVKNQDLWMELDRLVTPHQIDWQWVKGHTGHPENERADQLANRAIDEMLRQ